MITLFTFGPAFGLRDPSPFVMKAETLLRMAKLPYRTDRNGFSRAPKGKLPYIDDDGELVPDSTFIRWHIEKKYGIDFDRGLSPQERAVSWAFEKMAEDHLYWAVLHDRWMNDDNFAKGPAIFFRKIPAPVRPIVIAMVRRKVRTAAHAHGMGRHSRDEVMTLGTRAIDVIADFLGDKPYLMGAGPTGADAVIYAFSAGVLCRQFEGPLRAAAERHPNLHAYVERMTDRFYADVA